MVEREVVVRCVKHLLNKYIRECESTDLISAIISHIFNCLLAPTDFLNKMDEGLINYQQVTVKSLSDFNLIEMEFEMDE